MRFITINGRDHAIFDDAEEVEGYVEVSEKNQLRETIFAGDKEKCEISDRIIDMKRRARNIINSLNN